ncbi:MAG: translation initiation factor IF-2 N-terminal domain-containing protein, partial [Alphaproteobacteria bacterium]
MAAKIKVIELAKELGVTSKDLMVTAEEMGHKGVRAMSPLDLTLANALRVKLGKGRDLPEAPVKPKRVAKAKAEDAGSVDGAVAKKSAARARKPKTAEIREEAPAEIKPAATIVKPKPAPTEPVTEPLVAATPIPDIVPEPLGVVSPMPAAPAVEPIRPAIAAGPAVALPKKPEPKIVPFRPLERPGLAAPPRPAAPRPPFAPPRVTVGP